ncbi:MAG: hypothetical protein LBL64_06075 [Treponema sp.]|jgi:tetratricopeptide (TPR) repeat protein|nr:hypothetical protein [Treponema sp.]
MNDYEAGANLGIRYYRLALSAAVRRDLTAAVLYARYALLFAPENPGAVTLLRLCCNELGEAEEAGPAYIFQSPNLAEGLEKVSRLAAEKKWRDAARAAGALPRQSVRILNISGCLWALAKDYAKAADFFAQALNRDRGSRLAAKGLAESTLKRKPFWNILGRIL